MREGKAAEHGDVVWQEHRSVAHMCLTNPILYLNSVSYDFKHCGQWWNFLQ